VEQSHPYPQILDHLFGLIVSDKKKFYNIATMMNSAGTCEVLVHSQSVQQQDGHNSFKERADKVQLSNPCFRTESLACDLMSM